jgi:hypothetical protein
MSGQVSPKTHSLSPAHADRANLKPRNPRGVIEGAGAEYF